MDLPSNNDDFMNRFAGIGRLFGMRGLSVLRRSKVLIVGVGGVGSWIVEALARSAIGHLALVDLDDVCLTNINRQLPALSETVGSPKVDVLGKRAQSINPECQVVLKREFFTASTSKELLLEPYDCVVDAMDDTENKCLLISECRSRGLPLIVSGGAGGRCDPLAIRVADLASTTHDPLLAEVRSRLRKQYGFPSGKEPFGVECVYTVEPVVYPTSDGSVCASGNEGPTETAPRLDCESGFGAATFVTGAFGFVAASLVVRKLIQRAAVSQPPPNSR